MTHFWLNSRSQPTTSISHLIPMPSPSTTSAPACMPLSRQPADLVADDLGTAVFRKQNELGMQRILEIFTSALYVYVHPYNTNMIVCICIYVYTYVYILQISSRSRKCSCNIDPPDRASACRSREEFAGNHSLAGFVWNMDFVRSQYCGLRARHFSFIWGKRTKSELSLFLYQESGYLRLHPVSICIYRNQ